MQDEAPAPERKKPLLMRIILGVLAVVGLFLVFEFMPMETPAQLMLGFAIGFLLAMIMLGVMFGGVALLLFKLLTRSKR